MPTRLATAIGLIDWNAAVIACGAARRSQREDAIAEAALLHVERNLSDHLVESGKGTRFRVRLRLYTGWHTGITRTPRLRGVTKVKERYGSRVRTYHRGCVAFLGGTHGIQFGAKLACVPNRLARKHGFHLLDTLRYREGIPSEKMVDTALVVDLLGLVGRKEADRYVVMSDDDDMLPGLLAAEAAGARVRMLSRPGMRSRFMAHTADLISTYEGVGR